MSTREQHEAMEAAKLAVNRRLAPVVGAIIKTSDAALTCSGTDVPGPELAAVLIESAEEASQRDALLVGVLLRTFWLGYRFGELGEEDVVDDEPLEPNIDAAAEAGQMLAVHWGHQPWSDAWARLVAETMVDAAKTPGCGL